ncbi:MAG TPA: ABC transporter permease [Trebonia sp.]|jgi:peptide/nickel transport system permease protein|nr:ABC transporter permease [Trebonia sp.]
MAIALSPEQLEQGLRRSRQRRAASRWLLFVNSPGRAISAVIVVVFALMAIIGPYLYPKNLPINPNDIYAPPSLAHPLGTDFEGADTFALIVTGARYVLFAAAIAAVITVVIGTAAGLTAGYYPRLAGSAIMRVTDFVLAIPGFPVLLVLATIWDFGSLWQMALALGVFGWGGIARAVRAQTLSLRERPFVEAARGLGIPGWRIISAEVMPNVAPFIGMNLMLQLTGFIYTEVGLFFLGAVPYSTNNWGVMLNNAVFQANAMTSPRALSYLLSPLICILLITLALVTLANAVDEFFNPRLRRVR